MSFKDKIDKNNLPQHIAIIMDGNGRWAKEKGELRVFGHKNGVTAVREALEASVEIGLKYLTLYAFSTENWNRPQFEVDALMELLVNSLNQELPTFQENNIRVNSIGRMSDLPDHCQVTLQSTIDQTKNNTGCTLTLALSYGSRQEILDATKAIAEKVKKGEISIDEINEDLFSQNLYTNNIPDPDLLIRTSGEERISNYMLWQIAYSELFFLPIMWPEFSRETLFECIYLFQNRERRFGKTSEQL
ncbi:MULTISPECIES: isoprenyl transferase [Sphingobacterium]|uniref:Isoprenyl transferase n=1 Tax=Sphingobacterium cellulitidis TaxID=1768011 RepID=A0A8H9KZC9_9SPHI|nr:MULTISPECIES: isoprenyl transferase [Sphingobacterium]MBA8988602.1 undecaprenyl diphosphate synthase [Sphingobacterium soli]OYD43227.1 isoprenyl transferase [Sphingobacterium cellulitidis]OYD47434.1 isoprenyl transferase [Sphingobacterium cellulitidis]WFB62620.1 isoprenyl transferase [Sphingobacterium sp. WM]GGE34114.1 isoprenyl transferase [Sphingobacterium soli]